MRLPLPVPRHGVNLGKAVDVAKFHQNEVDTLTLGHVLGGGGVHTYAEVMLADNFFDETPDFVHGRFDEQMGGTVCHYVRANTTLSPNHIGKIDATYSLSASGVSHASSNSMHAGFSLSTGFVSVSSSLSKSGAHSSSLSAFSGNAKASDVDYMLQLSPDANFKPGILDGIGDYDGSPASRLKYTNLFMRLGTYFVSEVTTGGYYSFTTSVTKTAKADSSQYALEFKAKVGFVSGSGGTHHADRSDEFHTHEDSTMAAVGGDDALRANMLQYLPMMKNETISLASFQKDYGAFFSSVPANPVLLDIKVSSTSSRG